MISNIKYLICYCVHMVLSLIPVNDCVDICDIWEFFTEINWFFTFCDADAIIILFCYLMHCFFYIYNHGNTSFKFLLQVQPSISLSCYFIHWFDYNSLTLSLFSIFKIFFFIYLIPPFQFFSFFLFIDRFSFLFVLD